MDIALPPTNNRRDAIIGIVAGAIIAEGMIALGVYLLNTYGWTLFVATPFVASATSAFCYNFRHEREIRPTLGVGLLSLLLAACLLFLFAMEGLICILMAALPAALLGLAGAATGYVAAQMISPRATHAAIAVILLPLMAGLETNFVTPPLNEVVTTIEIDAPPEAVWPYVIAYSSLPEPREPLFRTGIAYPIKVWLEGEGIGATRYCGFSTGTYVEPITRWEPPYRLSFDVTSTPPAMKELSIYNHVHAPHLDETPRNRRGEFRLTRLRDNRTRLEGSTWYEIGMYPQFYWRWWADNVVHTVHQRVFNHIKQQAETMTKLK